MSTGPIVTPTLRTLKGAPTAALYELGRAATVLGKAPDCDIVLDRNTVSKRHAMIERRPDGHYLVDLDSRNKTYLDGQAVDRPVRLRDGHVIGVCDFLFAFCQPAVVAEGGDRSTILGVQEAPQHAAAGARPEEKLRALMAVNRELTGTLDLRDVLAGALKTLFHVFPQADRGFVLLEREGGAGLVPIAIEGRRGDPGHLTISRAVFDHVMGLGRAVLSQDAAAEFGTESLAEAGVCTLMAVPLRGRKRRPTGILQLDTRDRRGRFGADDLDLLAAVAGQVGLAVENARLHAVELRQHGLDQEARDARAVQRAMLPARKPALAGYEFWDRYEPARSVGGDYFDYVPLGHDGTRWAVAVGDVEGKGMPAALCTARLCAEVRWLLLTEPGPAQVVSRLNQGLCEPGGAGKIVTFLLTVLDGADNRLTAVSAGHMAPLVRRAGGRVEVLGEDSGGLVLGVEGGQTYRAAETTLGPGDVVVLYTDGVSEATDREGRQFGAARLAAALAAAPAGPAAAGESVLREFRRHTAGCPQGDDVTLLCFGRP